jgi:predicted acetyltransferase
MSNEKGFAMSRSASAAGSGLKKYQGVRGRGSGVGKRKLVERPKSRSTSQARGSKLWRKKTAIRSKVAAASVASPRGASPRLAPQKPPAPEFQFSVARAGDHPDIYHWMLAVFHGPSRNEFHASQDQPQYEPNNRLLLRAGRRIVSHVQTVARTVQFGDLKFPVDQLAWLGTLPEFRGQGAAARLLHAADEKMRADGAVLGALRTRAPHYFRRFGWAVCGRHCYSRAKARDVLARFWADPALGREPVNIRQWRHVELPALMRIYAQNIRRAYGPLERSEAYWRWLICRRAFDHIVVAIAGPDKLELNEETAPIAGYAVVRQHQIVELLTDPAFPTAAPQLLARCCADAIERDCHEVSLYALPGDPLHELVQGAGGSLRHHECDGDEVFMVKILEPTEFIESLLPALHTRATAASFAPGWELGIAIEDDKYVLTGGRRGVSLSMGRLGRSYLTCNRAELTRLLLGHDDPAYAASQGRLKASTQSALALATALFPRLPLWQPAWDDLAA